MRTVPNAKQAAAQPDPLEPFTYELEVAICALPMGKAEGLDDIFPEFVSHFGTTVKPFIKKEK